MIVKDLYFSGTGYYSPSVLGFGDVKQHYQWDLRVEYEVMPSAMVMAGYQDIRFEFDNKAKLKVADGFYVGMGIKF